MPFQFLCPEGHLLQGDETQIGQQCRCPYCGLEFLVPAPDGSSLGPKPMTLPGGPQMPYPAGPQMPYPAGAQMPYPAGPQMPYPAQPAEPPPEPEPEPEEAPSIRVAGARGDVPEDVADRLGAPSTDKDILHILCPKGHPLETPRDMLGQDALCPFCQTQFRLRVEDSVEYKQQKAEDRERHDQKLGKAWLNWAIAAAVVVAFGVILLIVIAASQ